jgi:hypothetical protein
MLRWHIIFKKLSVINFVSEPPIAVNGICDKRVYFCEASRCIEFVIEFKRQVHRGDIFARCHARINVLYRITYLYRLYIYLVKDIIL